MRRSSLLILPVLGALLTAGVSPDARACIWDKDTLAMERQRFPGALELITGHFVHHGPAFYAWRIEDRTERLKERPEDLALLDDLAAAYEKTGDHAAAIATMERALALDPDRYETHANLGTYNAHAGHFDLALKHIDRALEINPQAHFGRERYQALLIRYVQDSGGVADLPLAKEHRNFADFVLRHGPQDGDVDERLADATTGVLGMMHFGKHDSPILLEALGDLLSASDVGTDAAQLAARAYFRAASMIEDAPARRVYRSRAREVLTSTHGMDPKSVEAELDRELARGQAFVAKMRADEERFLDSSDPEAAFDAAYFDGMDLSPPDPVEQIGETWPWAWPVATGALGLLLACFGAAAVRRRRRGF